MSLYVHLPWCVQKCPYCDFNSHKVGNNAPFDRYVAALISDLEAEAGEAAGRPIKSIFLGGGTPSLFSPEKIAAVLDAGRAMLALSGECEITMEANPGTLEHGSLKAYRDAGITRLSLGAQSFDAGMLRSLGRIHGPDEISNAYAKAEAAGFDSINIDLMFALPGQSLDMAMADIDRLLEISPPHVSYYQLTLEPNTVFYRQPPKAIPDDDTAWSVQEQGQKKLTAAGYEQYEISAFAKPGQRCQHNLNYWQFGDYLAAGAGAHGKLTDFHGQVRRYRKPANPQQFMEQVERGAGRVVATPVGDDELGFEFMLNVLRLSDGFTAELLRERTGLEMTALAAPLRKALDEGLLEQLAPRRWRPTPTGFRFLNDLQAQFLP